MCNDAAEHWPAWPREYARLCVDCSPDTVLGGGGLLVAESLAGSLLLMQVCRCWTVLHSQDVVLRRALQHALISCVSWHCACLCYDVWGCSLSSGPCLSGAFLILSWLEPLATKLWLGLASPLQYVKTFGKAEERREVKRSWKCHRGKVMFAGTQLHRGDVVNRSSARPG